MGELPADRVQSEFNMFEEFVRAPMPFKPIVDGDLVDDPFLPEEPLELLKKGTWNKVPLIIGTNKNEGLLIKGFFQRDGGKYAEAKDGWDRVGPLAFFHREKDEITEEESTLCQQYRRKHFGDRPWSGDGQSGEALVRMYGDLLFHAPADLLVKALTKDAEQPPVFHYLYSHQGPLSLYDLFDLRPWQLAIKIIGMKLGIDIFPSRDGQTLSFLGKKKIGQKKKPWAKKKKPRGKKKKKKKNGGKKKKTPGKKKKKKKKKKS